tara:strand:+ start:79 stop:489 length:411 start_codon:yes stop_codon:yes gene_type:complete
MNDIINSKSIYSNASLAVYLLIQQTIKMYIYNVTINIDESAHQEWLSWIQGHIQDVLATGKFVSAKLTQVLVEEEMGGATYSVQYTTASRENLDEYYKIDAPKLQGNGVKKFADKMVAFRTELKVVKEFYPISIHN